MKTTKITRRICSLLLLVALLAAIPGHALAADNILMPAASDYFISCSASVANLGAGRMQMRYSVSGTGVMDELGARYVVIYESVDNVSFRWVKNYPYDAYSGMISYNTSYHSSYVPYQGIAGRYYKCQVYFWGSKNGQSESLVVWSDSLLLTVS